MPKRSLILAGGGLKVGFQAGVLQVWLDEAGLTFDHADGASGGCLNLAMYCQGYSGTKIADQWRNYDPWLQADVNLEGPGQFAHMLSYFTLDNFRARVLPKWGIDWNAIRTGRFGTFNLLNFSKKRHEVVTNAEMNEDRLIGAVSLPMWFPPVKVDGDLYIDGVYITDANVEEAIRRGADEIWAIWTVSRRDEWRPGFVAQYFHIIEVIADTHFFAIWDRIARNNAEIAAGRLGEFGRTIAQRLIVEEVPVHYLFNFSRDRMAEVVNLGVETARKWCRDQGIGLSAPAPVSPPPATGTKTSLEFTEDMRGFLGSGATDFQAGYDVGKEQKNSFHAHLTIRTEDIDRFITDANHECTATGWLESPLLGGRSQVELGVFNLLVQAGDPRKKEMRYRLFCRHADGTQCTMIGHKKIADDKSQPEIWDDTTTLFTTLYRGRLDAGAETAAAQIAIGILKIQFFDFLRELTTFRLQGPDPIGGLARFGQLWLGKLQDVYGGFLTPA
jgi:predicted acylesterase/phospholipase RssA